MNDESSSPREVLVSTDSDGASGALQAEDAHLERHRRGEGVQRGQWFWVNSTERAWDEKKKKHVDKGTRWLACVMGVGTNHLRLEEPRNEGSGTRTIRVHFDEFWEVLEREQNPEPVIQERVAHFQKLATEHLEEIKAITARLGVNTKTLRVVMECRRT